MPINILIPTDFQPTSLNAIKKVVQDLSSVSAVHITLVHGYFLSDSITDLLFHSPQKIISKLSNKEFVEGCQLLQNKYASEISKISVELFHGYTDKSFVQFCEKRNIQKAYIPTLLGTDLVSKRSFDLTSFIKRNIKDVYAFEMNSGVDLQTESVSDLFLKEV